MTRELVSETETSQTYRFYADVNGETKQLNTTVDKLTPEEEIPGIDLLAEVTNALLQEFEAELRLLLENE